MPVPLSHVNLTRDDVPVKKAGIDHEDGGLVYEVEFFRKGLVYEYDIDLKTGAILKVDKDRNQPDGSEKTANG